VRRRTPGTAQDIRKDGRYAGRVRLAVAADRSAESLCGFVEGAVANGTLIVTDDWSGYADLGKRGYDHRAFAEWGDPEISEEFLPISHLVFANLKTWLAGTHKRGQRAASAGLSQRVHVSIQPPLLPVQRFPLAARPRRQRERADIRRTLLRRLGAPYI
jgi:hypothetical protein